MRLKTQEEIEGVADKKGFDSLCEDHAFAIGYSQAQSDLVEQASEGFYDYINDGGSVPDNVIFGELLPIWQASQLSMVKTHISKKDHEIIVNQALSLHGKTSNGIAETAPDTYLRLKKEIESLKSDLDWITLNCKSGTEYSEFVFNYKMKEIRQRHCLDKSEGV